MADAKSVLEFARKHDAKILDLRFTDLLGLWHHISYPIEQLTEASFAEGFELVKIHKASAGANDRRSNDNPSNDNPSL